MAFRGAGEEKSTRVYRISVNRASCVNFTSKRVLHGNHFNRITSAPSLHSWYQVSFSPVFTKKRAYRVGADISYFHVLLAAKY